MKTVFHYLFIALSAKLCLAQRYILTPKYNVNEVHVSNLAKEHNLYELATFPTLSNAQNHLSLYIADHQSVMQYKETLSSFFEIEEDMEISLDNQEIVMNKYGSAPWHLDRIAKRNLPLDGRWEYGKTGLCHMDDNLEIDTYVVDTGIDVDHPEFGGRALWGENFADDVDTDCNNHGTHVAGLIGSRSFGVCVDAKLYAVKVLDCRGSGSLSGVIQGIEWAYKRHLEKVSSKNKTVKSIINMSLGGGFSRALNRAVESCLNNDDFYIVVAAGNENQDACNVSPASANDVISVMASDAFDTRAWFSNWGKCGTLYSPGVDVLSTIPRGDTAKYSGTSMASPVVAGVLNHYIDMYPQHNQRQMIKILQKMSSKGVIKGRRDGTSNALIYLTRE